LLHKEFKDATVFFVGFILSVLGDNLVDAYLHIRDGKELWDALEAKFGAADAGDKLYAMEQFNDYKMVENRSENKVMSCRLWAKELELLKCVLPDKFVVGCIVTKLPLVEELCHFTETSDENIIGSLNVEERARQTHWWNRGKICCQHDAEKCPQV
jgi:hypothetical protein